MSIASILSHMEHAYRQTDGTMRWPNSREGDMLRGAHAILSRMSDPDVLSLIEVLVEPVSAQGDSVYSLTKAERKKRVAKAKARLKKKGMKFLTPKELLL